MRGRTITTFGQAFNPLAMSGAQLVVVPVVTGIGTVKGPKNTGEIEGAASVGTIKGPKNTGEVEGSS